MRDPKTGRLLKGSALNPGGQPKMPVELAEYMKVNRPRLSIHVLERLEYWTRSKHGQVSIAACKALGGFLQMETLKLELGGKVQLEGGVDEAALLAKLRRFAEENDAQLAAESKPPQG